MPIVIDEWIIWSLFIGFVGMGILALTFGILTMMAFIFTPARTWIKAKLKHKPIVDARRRDRKIDSVIGDYEQGLVTTKEYGSFIVDPDSVYVSSKGGLTILPVNAEIGVTLSPHVLQIIDGLKRMGFDNIEEAMAQNAVWGRCTCGYEGIMDFEKDENGSPIIIDDNLRLKCPFANIDIKEGLDVQEKEGTAEKEPRTATDSNPADTTATDPEHDTPSGSL